MSPRFANVYCSQCGRDFGPGDQGFSHCEHHNHIDIVFDGPPSHESGRFVEVEDESGKSIKVGEWVKRPNGLWALRIKQVADVATEGQVRSERSERASPSPDPIREEMARALEKAEFALQFTVDRMPGRSHECSKIALPMIRVALSLHRGK